MDLGTEGFMKPEHAAINDALRERSGHVSYDDRLTSFLYELMRDHVPPGKIEELVRGTELEEGNVAFSNGWLASYAHNLAARLRMPKRAPMVSLATCPRDREGLLGLKKTTLFRLGHNLNVFQDEAAEARFQLLGIEGCADVILSALKEHDENNEDPNPQP